jgi:hypothetical protein
MVCGSVISAGTLLLVFVAFVARPGDAQSVETSIGERRAKEKLHRELSGVARQLRCRFCKMHMGLVWDDLTAAGREDEMAILPVIERACSAKTLERYEVVEVVELGSVKGRNGKGKGGGAAKEVVQAVQAGEDSAGGGAGGAGAGGGGIKQPTIGVGRKLTIKRRKPTSVTKRKKTEWLHSAAVAKLACTGIFDGKEEEAAELMARTHQRDTAVEQMCYWVRACACACVCACRLQVLLMPFPAAFGCSSPLFQPCRIFKTTVVYRVHERW